MQKLYTKVFTSRDHWINVDILDGKLVDLTSLLEKISRSLSLKLDRRALQNPRDVDYLTDIFADGFLCAKSGVSWERRFKAWKDSVNPPAYWLGMENGIFYLTTDPNAADEPETDLLPVFPHYNLDINALLGNTQSSGNKKMKVLSKEFTNRMFSQNQDAVKLATKMSVGKAANQVLTGKLTKTFPWYAKLFGKHKEVVNNPFVRIGTAEAVLAAVEHFYPENQKLKYVAEAMLQEAMVDVATNSNALKSVISELEALAGHLPGETK